MRIVNRSRKLRTLLGKLDIKSAKQSELEDAVAAMMETLQSDIFGNPDQLFVSPAAFSSLDKLLGGNKK